MKKSKFTARDIELIITETYNQAEREKELVVKLIELDMEIARIVSQGNETKRTLEGVSSSELVLQKNEIGRKIAELSSSVYSDLNKKNIISYYGDNLYLLEIDPEAQKFIGISKIDQDTSIFEIV